MAGQEKVPLSGVLFRINRIFTKCGEILIVQQKVANNLLLCTGGLEDA
jgi:hypothetical protein